MGHVSVAIIVAAVLSLGGCAPYQSKALTSHSVEQALKPPEAAEIKVAAETLKHPLMQPMSIDLERGISPDQAAVLAVILSPSLRSERDARAVSSAQLVQAGLLPNPTLSAGLELPHNNASADSFTGYNVGLDWEVTALIAHDAKVKAAQAQNASVDLDVAWKEWQAAQAAKVAAYDLIALKAALVAAREADQRQAQNLDLVRRAVDQHSKTLLDLSAAEAAAQDAHAVVLMGQRDLQHQISELHRAIGLDLDSSVTVQEDAVLPARLDPPPVEQLLADLEQRRLDLLALKQGYESQDQTLRAAILAQFPKLSFGVNAARDTSDVHTIGLGVALELPIFDNNRGVIATEKATRQKLFDEYISRVYEARWDITMAIEDIRATNAQIADAEAAVPGLKKFAEVYRDALQKGNTDVLSYYTAQTALINKQLAVVRLKQQLIENWIALEIAAGQYLPITQSPTTVETSK